MHHEFVSLPILKYLKWVLSDTNQFVPYLWSDIGYFTISSGGPNLGISQNMVYVLTWCMF